MLKHPSHVDFLPALSPDLVLVRRGQGAWQLVRVADRLAAGMGIPTAQLSGRTVTAVFPDAVPSLAELATEVVEQGEDLSAIRLQLGEGQADFLADIRFAGLTDDYLGQLVQFILRPDVPVTQRREDFHRLVGRSAAMLEVFRKIRLYAASDATVIITGETGAGKELVAHALHLESARRDRLFAAINCTAISEQLLESELFGHERGAFTGAVREHRGYFERADGGTLFLDEIGDMPLHTQGKLLRVLEDGQVLRVGGETPRKVDVRFIGATNVPLEQAVAQQRFRSDLYHRLAVLRIHLPALRERKEDIPLLADIFLRQFRERYRKPATRLTPEAVRLLQSYLWPGNVRELRNVMERVVIENETEAIGARAFTEWIRERQQFAVDRSGRDTDAALSPVALPWSPASEELSSPSRPSPDVTRGALTEEALRRAYRAAGGNLSAAARRLGIHRATLYRHLQKLDLTREDLG
ncbi:MAG: sigma 54-interacting transcriptional regulator [Pelovirga sp.]